jgi:isoleucyl-tRNA synthetase
VFAPPRPQRVLPSHHVLPTSGTGVVHMAPAHGAEDYAAFIAAGYLNASDSSVVCPVDGYGRYSESIKDLCREGQADFGARLVGKEVLWGGNSEILAILEESGVLVKRMPFKHKYPYDTRTKKPMIVR